MGGESIVPAAAHSVETVTVSCRPLDVEEEWVVSVRGAAHKLDSRSLVVDIGLSSAVVSSCIRE